MGGGGSVKATLAIEATQWNLKHITYVHGGNFISAI